MSNYVRKASAVQAVKLDPSTGDITIGAVTATAGNWLVEAEDGTLAVMDDATFTADYDLAPEPAPEPAPVEPQPADVPADVPVDSVAAPEVDPATGLPAEVPPVA